MHKRVRCTHGHSLTHHTSLPPSLSPSLALAPALALAHALSLSGGHSGPPRRPWAAQTTYTPPPTRCKKNGSIRAVYEGMRTCANYSFKVRQTRYQCLKNFGAMSGHVATQDPRGMSPHLVFEEIQARWAFERALGLYGTDLELPTPNMGTWVG